MDGISIIGLITAIGGFLAGVGALIRVLVDRRTGVRGHVVDTYKLDLSSAHTSMEMMTALLSAVREDNDSLRTRLVALDKEIDKLRMRNAKLELEVTIRRRREQLLITVVVSNNGDIPDLPALPHEE